MKIIKDCHAAPFDINFNKKALMTTTPKVALVTGAGTGIGIGKAVALAFLREGYSVGLARRSSGS